MSSRAATRTRVDEAFALEEAGDIGAAIDRLSQAIEHAPGDAYPRACRGRMFKLRGQWRRAIADFDAALAIRPAAPAVLFLRGCALAAIEDLEHSTDLDPWNAAAQFELGALFVLVGDLAQAIERYQRAFDLEPDAHPGAPARIAELARQLPS